MSQRRLLASLQAPFLKEKKGVRFSALYLHQKRNLLVLDHSHQQIRKGNLLLDLQKLQMNPIFRISVDIFVRAFTTSANVPSIYIQLFWNTLTHDAKTRRSLLHDNIVPKPDLALELGKSISLTEVEEEAVAREVHATHARIVSESEPEPTQTRQSGKLENEQETGNILGVPDESIVVSRASSEGTGSKPGVPDEEKLILEWEADVDSEHFDRDDNARDDNEETKPDHEEIDNHVALAGPNPEHMQDVFLATNYPKGGASSGPEPFMMTPGQLNSGLAPSHVPATTNIPPTDKDLEILFQPMFDEYFEQSTDSEPVPTATVVNAPIVSTNTSVSTTIAQDAPSTSHSLSSLQVHPPVFPQGVAAGPTIEDTSITQADLHPSVNPVAGEPGSAQSTSGDVSLAEPNQVNQPPDHLRK
ncbi:hypothetical protein Tco_0340342 [Tanacetum coccineum]